MNHLGIPICFKLFTIVGRPSVLPDNCIVNRKPRFFIPHNGRFTLVSNSYTGYVFICQICFCHSFHNNRALRVPYFIRIVLNPSKFRKVLLKVFLRGYYNLSLMIENYGTRTSSSLIKCKYIFILEIHNCINLHFKILVY